MKMITEKQKKFINDIKGVITEMVLMLLMHWT